jgi:TRAP-type mannitol/chloroaromatic compound transport system permease small subunit
MEEFIRKFGTFAKWLSLSIVPLCMIAIFLIIGISVGEVVLRGIRGKGITDSLDLITALVPVTACTALACAQYMKRNIKVTLFTERLPEKSALYFDFFGLFLGFVIVTAGTVMGVRALKISLRTGEYFSGSHLTIPAWPGKLMMPLGFGALSIQLLADILEDLLKLSKYGKEQSQ